MSHLIAGVQRLTMKSFRLSFPNRTDHQFLFISKNDIINNKNLGYTSTNSWEQKSCRY